jgi:hypothetical protein
MTDAPILRGHTELVDDNIAASYRPVEEDDLLRGIAIGLPISLLLWAAIIGVPLLVWAAL